MLTVDEYATIPSPPDGRWELRGGELVKVTYPKGRHTKIQNRIVHLLTSRSERFGVVDKEFPFSAHEGELRGADVALISHDRWQSYDLESYFKGAPDIVIEVVSPSNTADEIDEKQALCLATGCPEFWVVMPKIRAVRVSTPDKRSVTYTIGDSIPLLLLPGAEPLPVSDIFQE